MKRDPKKDVHDVLLGIDRRGPSDRVQALAHKGSLIRHAAPALEDIVSSAAISRLDRNEPTWLPRKDQSKLDCRPSALDLTRTSFGAVGSAWDLVTEYARLDGYLVLPFSSKKLGWVRSDSLRLFRWHPDAERWQLEHDSRTHPREGFVSARIDRAGTYALFGLNEHPMMRQMLQTAYGFSTFLQMAPAQTRERVHHRLCELILCGNFGDLDQADWLRQGGQGLPAWPEAPQVPMAGFCEVCEEMTTRTIFDLPEFQLLPAICLDTGWHSVGPERVRGFDGVLHRRGIGCTKEVMIDPGDPKRLYVAAEHGGLWVCNDIDQHPSAIWHPLTDRIDGMQMRGLAVAKSDPERLYVANSLGQVWRSNNRGSSWALVPGPDFGFVRRILVHPSDPDVIFVASNNGLRISPDGGTNWTQLLDAGQFPSQDVLDAALDPADSSILYIGIRARGVLKTTSSGQFWDQILDFSAAIEADRRMIRLSLGQRDADGTPQTDSNRRVVAKLGREVFVSSDGGETWTSKGARGGAGGSPARSDGGIWPGEWCNVAAVDPHDPDVIMAGQQELFVTRDGGDTWRAISGGPRIIHEDMQCIAWDSRDPGQAYIANDGGLYRYRDERHPDWDGSDTQGETFLELHDWLSITEFFRVGIQGNRAVGCADHNGLRGSNDLNGGIWERANLNDRGGSNALERSAVYADPVRDGRFYVFHSPDQLFRLRYPSTGQDDLDYMEYGNFPPHRIGRSKSLPVGAVAVDTRQGSSTVAVCAGRKGSAGFRLMITREADTEPSLDAAGNPVLPLWETAWDNGDTEPVVSVVFSGGDPGRIFAITEDGDVLSKADVNAGAVDEDWQIVGNWSIPSGNGVRQLVTHPSDSAVLYAIDGESVGRSVDGGATWVTLPSVFAGTELNTLAHHPGNSFRLYVGTDIGVFVSDTQGDSWQPFDENLPNAEVLQLLVDGGFLYAVTHGRGLWRRAHC